MSYILEHLIGALKGIERAYPRDVEIYMNKVNGFVMGINRIRYDQLNVDYLRRLLKDLEGERGVQMGILRQQGDEYVPTGLEFPKHVADFKIFYLLLKQVCKIAIAEQDAKEAEREIEELQRKEMDVQIAARANVKRLEILRRVHALNAKDPEVGAVGAAVEKVANELKEAANGVNRTLHG